MSFFNAVIKKTLRCYPIVLSVIRQAKSDDIIPLDYPVTGTSGEPISRISISRAHRIIFDFTYVAKWRPERFLESSEAPSIALGVYGNLLTFNAGIRACVGWHFALMEPQALTFGLVDKFSISPPALGLDEIQAVSFGLILSMKVSLALGSKIDSCEGIRLGKIAEFTLDQFQYPPDCIDAVNFLSSNEFKKATGGHADPSKIILNGSSVGGWISLIVGNSIGFKEAGITPIGNQEAIKGIVSIYPMTNLGDEFFKKPNKPLGIIGKVINLPEDKIIAEKEVQPFVDPDHTGSRTASAPFFETPRTLLYFYGVQEGIVEELLLGGTGLSGTVFSVPKHLRNLSPAEGVPPIYLIHGGADGSVPVSSS
ncbi:hypothetical protein D9757_002425 [Collybiopsis confluens]|uniref:Alpha/beta hydrolase fold-3 domain-containing protein n=1 Tax=Collybiopsis confluens TaxID=2823264 RepID=A0A8H5MF14_9AGAR|nr:hypothetical protein D9757_002425 [Collybiopsis confluens]